MLVIAPNLTIRTRSPTRSITGPDAFYRSPGVLPTFARSLPAKLDRDANLTDARTHTSWSPTSISFAEPATAGSRTWPEDFFDLIVVDEGITTQRRAGERLRPLSRRKGAEPDRHAVPRRRAAD